MSKYHGKGKAKQAKRGKKKGSDRGWDGRDGYIKTDSKSNLCFYDCNHNLKRIIEPTDPEYQNY